jgi:hypothetical protein
MSRSAVILAAVLAAVAGPALASKDDPRDARERYELASDRARCTARPAAEWLSIDQLTQKLKEQGYTIGKVEVARGAGFADAGARRPPCPGRTGHERGAW